MRQTLCSGSWSDDTYYKSLPHYDLEHWRSQAVIRHHSFEHDGSRVLYTPTPRLVRVEEEAETITLEATA